MKPSKICPDMYTRALRPNGPRARVYISDKSLVPMIQLLNKQFLECVYKYCYNTQWSDIKTLNHMMFIVVLSYQYNGA